MNKRQKKKFKKKGHRKSWVLYHSIQNTIKIMQNKRLLRDMLMLPGFPYAEFDVRHEAARFVNTSREELDKLGYKIVGPATYDGKGNIYFQIQEKPKPIYTIDINVEER